VTGLGSSGLRTMGDRSGTARGRNEVEAATATPAHSGTMQAA